MIAKANRRHHRAMGHQLRVECRRIAYRRNCQHGLSTQCIDGRSPNAIHLGKLGGVAFVDFGNVSDRSLSIPTSLVYAAGPGLRYLTPVGPARIDFGYQLNRIPNLKVNGQPETRAWRIHFSIGQAF